MIIKKKNTWFKMLFEWGDSVLPQLLLRLLLLLLFSFSVLYFNPYLIKYNLHLNPAIFILFEIALALFPGFRNSASYDLLWEVRKLWGALVNNTQSLARQSIMLINDKECDVVNDREYILELNDKKINTLQNANYYCIT